MSYWDTSTLAKLYLPEADSPVFCQKAAQQPLIVTAKLSLHEMRRVAFRKESDGLIPANTAEAVVSQLDQDIAAGEIHVREMDAQSEAEFNGIWPVATGAQCRFPFARSTPSTWRLPEWPARPRLWSPTNACAQRRHSLALPCFHLIRFDLRAATCAGNLIGLPSRKGPTPTVFYAVARID